MPEDQNNSIPLWVTGPPDTPVADHIGCPGHAWAMLALQADPSMMRRQLYLQFAQICT